MAQGLTKEEIRKAVTAYNKRIANISEEEDSLNVIEDLNDLITSLEDVWQTSNGYHTLNQLKKIMSLVELELDNFREGIPKVKGDIIKLHFDENKNEIEKGG